MCTALTYHTKDHYFGRNLDLSYSYGETVTVTPRNYPFRFRGGMQLNHHHAMIGMACVREGYPLYYDAVNECGLAMAGLEFPGAVYEQQRAERDNVAAFELIPWLLGQCATVEEAGLLLGQLSLWEEAFSAQLPPAPLHWMVADREECIVVEPMAEGLRIHDNPVGVMTNQPDFPFMQQYLTMFRDLSPALSVNRLTDRMDLPVFCHGLAAVGLPGDWSSPSRFVRAAFARLNAVSAAGEAESVGQFFHLLGTVERPRGCVQLEGGRQDITVYSSCCNQDRGIYYYTTYENRRITAVDLHGEELEGDGVVSYPLRTEQDILRQN
ncbi:MAG: choloylglycine hydrolase family protein [Ruminococcaceae bacterium]|nr:choloylglycine hydrolase family protein [Oscillospiraceae bacterium]